MCNNVTISLCQALRSELISNQGGLTTGEITAFYQEFFGKVKN